MWGEKVQFHSCDLTPRSSHSMWTSVTWELQFSHFALRLTTAHYHSSLQFHPRFVPFKTNAGIAFTFRLLLLIPFQLMPVCTIVRETKELRSISISQKRIASSPTQHYVRHPQQTPSLQSCESPPPVVLQVSQSFFTIQTFVVVLLSSFSAYLITHFFAPFFH